MARSSSFRPTTRRRFLKVAGAAGLSAALASPVVALAQRAASSAGSGEPKAPPHPGAPPAAPDTTKAQKPSEFADDAKALAAVIQRRHGKYLDAKQLQAITDELDGRMQGGKALRAAALANSDEPEFTFRA